MLTKTIQHHLHMSEVEGVLWVGQMDRQHPPSDSSSHGYEILILHLYLVICYVWHFYAKRFGWKAETNLIQGEDIRNKVPWEEMFQFHER